jgi:hypothetical protein
MSASTSTDGWRPSFVTASDTSTHRSVSSDRGRATQAFMEWETPSRLGSPVLRRALEVRRREPGTLQRNTACPPRRATSSDARIADAIGIGAARLAFDSGVVPAAQFATRAVPRASALDRGSRAEAEGRYAPVRRDPRIVESLTTNWRRIIAPRGPRTAGPAAHASVRPIGPIVLLGSILRCRLVLGGTVRGRHVFRGRVSRGRLGPDGGVFRRGAIGRLTRRSTVAFRASALSAGIQQRFVDSEHGRTARD